jgi:PhzF family phenazine biosynthesis protein
MAREIVQIDAFTGVPFKGNPAAVCLLKEPAGEEWMQNVALEMNLSETAFASPEEDGYRLRWFTPAVEVELCGHATLATAYLMYHDQIVAENEQAIFHTKSGKLIAAKKDDMIWLDFPGFDIAPCEPHAGLLEGLQVDPLFVGKGTYDYLVEVSDEELVREAAPDFTLLRQPPLRGIILTAKGTGSYDFVSRFFAPKVGIPEDPVTGSAHCILGPYWRKRLGRDSFRAYQASQRGGEVAVEVEGARVSLGGQAVITMRGNLEA